LDDGSTGGTKGGLFAVITQMAGADMVAVDNGGCFDVTGASCGQKGGVNSADELSGSFGYHYFLASGAYHVNTSAASMCTITAKDAAGTTVTINTGINCFTTASTNPSTTFVCPAGYVNPCVAEIKTITTAVPQASVVTKIPGFTTTQYSCGSANALPGTAFG